MGFVTKDEGKRPLTSLSIDRRIILSSASVTKDGVWSGESVY
jgi:hypothetical protein